MAIHVAAWVSRSRSVGHYSPIFLALLRGNESGCLNCLAFLPCVINKLAVGKVHCVCAAPNEKSEKIPAMCLCSAVALGWTAAHKFHRWCSFGTAISLLPAQCLSLRVSSSIPGRRKRQNEPAVQYYYFLYRGVGISPPLWTPPPIALFIHRSFATFMWSTGWKFNLMTCLQAHNMILKPVTVKQRCHLHNDPSKIGLQPLPWQLVDKQKNGGRALWMDGRVVYWGADCSETWPMLQSWKGRALAHHSYVQAGIVVF